MKNRILVLLYFLLITCTVLAQEHVFILVDVSGSRGNDPIKTEARNQVSNLLLGQYSANGWTSLTVTDKKILDLISLTSRKPLISQNSWMCIIPFGNKDTYKKYLIAQNINHPLDFQTFFNQNYPVKYDESSTYIQIAEAFTASLAKTYNINEYYMFIVTDGLGDQDDTNSKNNYDPFEENLLLEWNNTSSSIVKNVGALTKSKYYINLRKVTNVKGTSIPTSPGIQPLTINDTTPENAVIKIISPPKAKKGNEHEIKSETVNINWACPTCPKGTKYKVTVSRYDAGKNKIEPKENLSSPTTSFNLPDGKFKITVSASNFVASSDYTCISVSTGSYGLLIFLLILIAAIGIGYYFWNKKRQEKIDVFTSNDGSDIFTKNSGAAANSNSSNSDYF